ncbi:MAG: hypothetical protein WD941_05630 [Opitutus sp.]
MNKRVIWLAVAIGLILAGYFVNRRMAVPVPAESYASKNPLDWGPIPYDLPPLPPVNFPPPDLAVPVIEPPPVSQTRGMTMPLEVPIQDGATVDFSIGAPVVRSGGADTEALDRALKEMAEAAKGVVFPPAGEPPAPPTK